MGKPHYDVALSFAGEDREYVDQVAEQLRRNHVRVFYDRYEEASLWGKDLYVHLSDVYRSQAYFTIIFVSRHYAAKLWPSHERQSAQARALSEAREYILPARFDDTELPGLLNSIGYVDLARKSPAALVELILAKLAAHGIQLRPEPRHRIDKRDSSTVVRDPVCARVIVRGPGQAFDVLFDPARYDTMISLLNELFEEYLHPFVPPFTYGSRWVLTETFGRRWFVPCRWVGAPSTPIHELADDWGRQTPVAAGLEAGTCTHFRMLQENLDPRLHVLGCRDEALWRLACKSAKAMIALREMLERVEPLDFSPQGCERVGVFEIRFAARPGEVLVEPAGGLSAEQKQQLRRFGYQLGRDA